MSNILSFLNSANAKLQNGLTTIRQPVVLSDGTVVQDPSDVHLYNLRPDGWVPPEDTNQTATTSAGHDNALSEDVVATAGNPADTSDDPLVDRVDVASFDLGQYSDSVSSVDLSAIPGDAELNFVGYDAHGNAIVSLGPDGVYVTLDATAQAYLVQLGYEGGVGPIGIDVEALIGASANVGGDIRINPMEGDFMVEVQAGVVVGATVNANGELELGHVTVEAGATGIAGLAADVNLNVGFEDWEFEFDAGAKLAFLIGGGADISFSVDAGAIVADLGDAGEIIWDQSGNIIGGVVDFGGDVIDFGADIPGHIGDAAGAVAGAAGDAAGAVGDGLDKIIPGDGLNPFDIFSD